MKGKQKVNPERDIKENGLSMGARVVGIASVEAINRFAPPGHQPDDLLRGARSVIVLGGAEPLAGAWKARSDRVLGSVGYNPAQIVAGARLLSYHIENRYGYCAVPVPIGAWEGSYPFLSLKLCAEMAGLGTRSMAGGIILNPDYGLLFFSAVLTTLPLREDGPMKDLLCPHESCIRIWEKKRTTPCLSSCPADCLSGEIKDGKIAWMEYKQDRCRPRAQNIDLFQKLLTEAVNETDSDRKRSILFGSRFSRMVRRLAYSTELTAQCYQCLKRCPFILRRLRGFK
jgi:hypothetical protein